MSRRKPKWYKMNDRQKSEHLRRRAPQSEAQLAHRLTGQGVLGWSFRWNERCGDYFPDYCCEPLGLIIEIDGRSHIGKEAADAERQEALEVIGYAVVRIKAAMPIHEKLEAIERHIRARMHAIGMDPPEHVGEARKRHAEHRDMLAD